MTQKGRERDQRERNFIALRLTNMLAEAAGYACYFKIPIGAFVQGAGDAYLESASLLDSKEDEVIPPTPAAEVDQG